MNWGGGETRKESAEGAKYLGACSILEVRTSAPITRLREPRVKTGVSAAMVEEGEAEGTRWAVLISLERACWAALAVLGETCEHKEMSILIFCIIL